MDDDSIIEQRLDELFEEQVENETETEYNTELFKENQKYQNSELYHDTIELVDISLLHDRDTKSLKNVLLKCPAHVSMEEKSYDPIKLSINDVTICEGEDESFAEERISHTIRWKWDDSESTISSTNTHLIQWSNNSWSLAIGGINGTMLDLVVHSLEDEHNYLYIKQGEILEDIGRFDERWMIRRSVVDGSLKKAQTVESKVKSLVIEKDPEVTEREMQEKEMKKIRDSRKERAKLRSRRQFELDDRNITSGGSFKEYLEASEDDFDETEKSYGMENEDLSSDDEVFEGHSDNEESELESESEQEDEQVVTLKRKKAEPLKKKTQAAAIFGSDEDE